MIAKTRAELPEKYGCRLCEKEKLIDEMILIRRRRTNDFVLRPQCKECHNKRERGNRREYKTKYLRLWRARNPELNESYWRSRYNREDNRLAASLRNCNLNYVNAVAIQRRLRKRGMKISIGEARALLKKYGPCYPTRYGLTPMGRRECERIRGTGRRHGKPLSNFEIRLIVYEDGYYITPARQKIPYQKAAEKLRDWWAKQKSLAGSDRSQRDCKGHVSPVAGELQRLHPAEKEPPTQHAGCPAFEQQTALSNQQSAGGLL